MGGFFKDLLTPQSTMDECRADTLEMLHQSQEMFFQVLRALRQGDQQQVHARLKGMDAAVNRAKREVRQKIFRHLAMSRGRDLLPSLQLHDIVNEIERVGDYSKNIAELADMVSGPVDWGRYEDGMAGAHRQVLEMFDLTFRTVESDDRDASRRCDELYIEVAHFCDAVLEAVIGEDVADDDQHRVRRSHLSLILLARYTKRVAAHLRNAVLTITNPYNRLGYQP